MRPTKKENIPMELFEKGRELSAITGLPRTKMFGILSEGISMPYDVQVKKIPRSKDLQITAIWKKSWRMKL